MKKLIYLCSIVLLSSQLSIAQTIIYVDKDATGAEDGTSWTNAYVSIAQAKNACAGDCDIYIAEGIYGGIGRIESETKQYRFYGGFSGSGSVFADRDWETYKTIVSGDTEGNDNVNADGITLSTDDIVGTNGGALTTWSLDGGPNFNTYVLVDGLIFTGCVASGSSEPDNYGGAIANAEQGDMIVRNCKFYGNESATDGGAIYAPSEVTNCEFYGNKATNKGGAIYDPKGATVDRSIFANNEAEAIGISAGYGYAIYYQAGNAAITNSLFYGHARGAIRAGSAPGNIFLRNTTLINGGVGGLSLDNGSFIILNSIIDTRNDPSSAAYENSFVRNSGGSSSWVSTGTDRGGNIDGDIQYLDSANLDFRLASTSPAINNGSNTFVQGTLDLNGDTRIQETTVDIGAYEGGVDLTPPTIALLSPEDRSVVLTTQSAYNIKFSEPIKSVNTSMEVALYKPGGSRLDPPVLVESTSSLTFGSNEMSFSLSKPLDAGATYFVVIQPGDIEDIAGNSFAGTGESNWSFKVNVAPTNITLSNSSIEEGNSAGDVIGNFTTVDANGSFDSHTYTFVNDANGPDNSSFTIDGNELKAADVFDVSAQSSYQINVMTTDANGATYTESFTITIDGDPIVNIPDAVLKQQIINDGVDANSDGDIQESEALATRELNLSMSGATDLTGLEAFSNLEKLIMFSSDVVTMVIPQMASLDSLSLQGHLSMTSLDLSNVSSISYLSIIGNTSLSGLDLSSYTGLRYLRIRDNGLNSIDLSALTNLEELSVRGSSATSLDISNNTNLKVATIRRNTTLTSVSLGTNTSLTYLSVSENNLSGLDVTGLSVLDTLYTSDNPITSLDMSGNPNLSLLYAYNNDLTSLDLSANPTLDLLNVRLNSNLTYLNLKNGNNSDINSMNANNTALTCIEVSDVAYAESSGWIIPSGATYAIDCSTIAWDGTAWSNSSGPTSTDNVSIQGDFSGGFECADLTITSGNSLTINSGETLIVNGDIINNNSLFVLSGGSLITTASGTISGNNIFIERNTRYFDGKYSFVGTPIEQDASIIGSDLGSYVFKYDETQDFGADGTAYWIDASSDQLVPGKGYTQANQMRLTFFGIPNAGTITYSATYTEDTDDANEGWNLVANPYPAAIAAADFIQENTNTTGPVYIWDDNGSEIQRGTSADYIVANGVTATNTTPAGGQTRYNQHIGSAQGFFIKLSDNTDTDISFTESMRVSGNNSDDNFFRSEQTPIARINLTDGEGLFKQTVVAMIDEAEEDELVRKYDAQAFSATADYGLFTLKAGRSLAINSLPNFLEKVQMQINVAEAAEYTISAELEAFDQTMFLLDKETGVYTDLSTESYTFSITSGIHVDRFVLVTAPESVLNVKASENLIFGVDKTIHIRTAEDELRAYRVYDMRGQLVLSVEAKGSAEINASNLKKGIYLVFAGEKTHKIILE